MNEKKEMLDNPPLSDFLNIYPPLSTNNNIIIDSRKYFLYFGQLKQKNQKNPENFKSATDPNPYPPLLQKILNQQKNRISRTPDTKEAIKLFLYHSDLIQKLRSYFSDHNSYKENSDNDNNLINLDKYIEKIINKLTDSVVLEKFEENKFIIKYGDTGNNCYFVLSGKISILKPVQYKNIKISYHDYLKYLSNLFANDELYFALKVVELNNKTYFKFHNLEYIKEDINNLKSFIKSYFIILLYQKIKSNLIDYTNIATLETNLKEFNFTFKDFDVDSKKLSEYINQFKQDDNNDNTKPKKINSKAIIKKYILDIFSPTEDDIYNMKPYEAILFKNITSNINKYINNQKNILPETPAILYKYDIQLSSGPGTFFGEMSLNANPYMNRRNATIRTEEECFMFSLTQKLYNSILEQSINMIKEFDIALIKRHYFFGEISPKIFDKMYYSMFKLISKEKNDFIYKQNSRLNSVYFLKEGNIKFEINLSVIAIYNLIKHYIYYLSENRRLFNFSDEQIYELNKTYLSDYKDLYLGNKLPIFKDKVSEIKKYEICNVTNFEVLGLLEFMSKSDTYNTSCYVVSKAAKVFELSKDNLDIMLNREKKNIFNVYFKFAKDRFLVMIKRLYSIRLNCVSNIQYKIKENLFFNNEENYDFLNYIKEEKKGDNNEIENNRYNNNTYNNINDNKNLTKFPNNIDKSYNIKRYESIPTSPIKNKKVIKKIKLPYTNRNNFLINEYNKLESQKSSIFSGTPLKSAKFNEDYFIKNKAKIINRLSNSNFIKRNENNSNKSRKNKNPNSIIDILLSPNEKKINSKNSHKILKSPLNLKKSLNHKSNDLINIGNNNFFTLEKLKTKLNEKKLDKNMFDLSIVKNEQKSSNKSTKINHDITKLNLNLHILKRNAFSPFYFHNSKLKKIMLLHNNDNSNIYNNSDTDFSCFTNITSVKK